MLLFCLMIFLLMYFQEEISSRDICYFKYGKEKKRILNDNQLEFYKSEKKYNRNWKMDKNSGRNFKTKFSWISLFILYLILVFVKIEKDTYDSLYSFFNHFLFVSFSFMLKEKIAMILFYCMLSFSGLLIILIIITSFIKKDRNKYNFDKIKTKFYYEEVNSFILKFHKYNKNTSKVSSDGFFKDFKNVIIPKIINKTLYIDFNNIYEFMHDYYFWLNYQLEYCNYRMSYEDAINTFDEVYFSAIIINLEKYKKVNPNYQNNFLKIVEL